MPFNTVQVIWESNDLEHWTRDKEVTSSSLTQCTAAYNPVQATSAMPVTKQYYLLPDKMAAMLCGQ